MEAIGEQGELDTSRTKMLSEVSSGYTYLAEGDVCIAKITPCFENGKGAIVRGLKNGLAFATTEVVPLRCQPENSPEFLYYLLTSAPFNKLAEGSMYGAGGQKRVADSFVANYHFAKPSLPEQTQIAKFLDHETAKIDRLIEKQEALIRLLKEKRQAVISHAVTKGLNPHAPLIDSGIQWLGQVPAHWKVASLKFYADVIDCKHITAEFLDEGFPLASIGEVKGWYVNLEGAKRTTQKFYSALIEGGRKPGPGDIIFTRNATVGEAAIVPANHHDFAMGQDVCLIRVADALSPEYTLHVLKSRLILKQLDLAMIGSTFKRINVDDIRNFVFAIPPVDEQTRLAAAMNRISKKYDRLILEAENSATLLQERRTALISAAVTGKIDVRHWQPPAVVSGEATNVKKAGGVAPGTRSGTPGTRLVGDCLST
jgi:type I restriction enzyme, S subunit